MTDLIGGAVMMLGGASLAASSMTLSRAAARPIAVARELLGNSDDAVPRVIPSEHQQLLDQLD